MLKRLELIGFKSFADKTVIEFHSGITAIVGPNGSGKSNIVDAVRWILGEQSAKSLRGGEMADVIFNGSTSRRSLGMAEVSMVFANDRRQLAFDADEVRITRRVYRDGQGEYLINNQPSRLKDIKDLFLGSGAGQGAYCIIEQGRVDVLLQASHKDRRQIFEEAAGISRFKARKVETLRKLESVEQNLARSRDLLAELGKQLRSVQLQAAKAQRYQEHSSRLRELRVGLGLQEYHDLTVQLQGETGILGRLRAELEHVSAQEAEAEQSARQLEEQLGDVESRLRTSEADAARARQAIAAQEMIDGYEAGATEELEAELDRARKQRRELAARLATLESQTEQALQELQRSETQAQERRGRVAELEQVVHEIDSRVESLRRQVESDRAEHLERMRQATRLQNEVISVRARLDNLRARRDGLRARSAQAAEHLASIDQELEELVQSEAHIQQMLVDARAELGRNEDEREALLKQAEEARDRLAELRVRRSGLASRIELLEQLERSQEGLGTGVREVLELMRRSQESESNPVDATDDWSFVIGLVADHLTVPREIAPLIDLALGEVSQCFLVRDAARLDEALRRRERPFAGRVGFVPVPPETATPANGLHSTEVGQRADLLIRCESPELSALPAMLLGSTRLVDDLATARLLAARPDAAQLRFITRQGELLEADGTLTVGTHHAEAGILSRKSELRELRQQAAELDELVAEAERTSGELQQQADALDEPIYFLQQRIADLVEEAGEMRVRVSQHRERRSGLHDEVALSRNEIDGLEQEIESLSSQLEVAQQRAEESEAHAAGAQERAVQADRELRERELERAQREQECSQARIELAQVEERLAGQRQRHAVAEEDRNQRSRELARLERDEVTTLERIRESRLKRLRAIAELAESYLAKEEAEHRITGLAAQRESLLGARQQSAERLQAAGGERQQKWELVHTHEMRASELRLRLDGLCQRLRDDYQIELAEMYDRRNSAEEEPPAEIDELAAALDRSGPAPPETATPPPRLDVAEAQREIDDLRKKLARLGAVNLDALQELAELEQRVAEKQAQHEDLEKSRADLLSIIEKINNDSRRMFTETFALIRSHFQELFRKLFGGGMADVFLEDETDVLESGIEVTARPPGKELRSISLLSGGERTLTAVALLLAIFRSKPSPFCLLDEVDAALDEANNARLAGVLREFLDLSQFIVITHKKRTMAVADVLYGITMQEAGVSRQVSVRFEDWPDEEPRAEEAA